MQDSKYRFTSLSGTDEGGIINRQSGELIPLDEPVMVFRARDKHALAVIEFYKTLILKTDNPLTIDPWHLSAVETRIEHFSSFANEHPDRMKFPDTEAS